MPDISGTAARRTGDVGASGESLEGIYDDFAATYASRRDLFDLSEVLDDLTKRLPSTGELCDLGCGAGNPVCSHFIARGWDVVGVDFSDGMLNLARGEIPQLRTLHGDMRDVDFEAHSFDAVTAVYSLFHVPWRDHPALFCRIHDWLRPGGFFLFTYATRAYTGSEEFDGLKTFMGRELFYSHTTPETLAEQLSAAQFEVVSFEERNIGGEYFLWVLAERPLSS